MAAGARGCGQGRPREPELQARAAVHEPVNDEFVRSLATWSGEGELGREERVLGRGRK